MSYDLTRILTMPALTTLPARLFAALSILALYLITVTITRITLLAVNLPEIDYSVSSIVLSLSAGFGFDLFVGLAITLPLSLALNVAPRRWFKNGFVRGAGYTTLFLSVFGLIYFMFLEYFFFGEFSSRLNYVAVDYLIYPHEVFVNLWDTYPVGKVLLLVTLLSAVFLWKTRQTIARTFDTLASEKRNFKILLAHSLIVAAGLWALNIDTTRISDNRTLNEITGNGLYSFAHAFATNELEYGAFYDTINLNDAYRRVRDLLADEHIEFLHPDSAHDITRRVTSDREERRYNIILILEESLGSKFSGTLHPERRDLTPHLDSLFAEGLLFSNIYATGNRTVRGLEAVTASFPPIPGRSIVKRPGCEHVFTLSATLKRIGYSTAFLYGGLSYFDNFKHYAENNSYDLVFDQSDISNPEFTTIWGVSDEDLFNASLNVFDSLHSLGQPFFATMITVSNHTPYTFPEGRIPYPGGSRWDAVRYSDYALGKFVRNAASHTFFDSTLFVILGDHGARVYGRQQIPFESYEIPLLFYCPGIQRGEVNSTFGSQLDVAPTILDFLGIDYVSKFFGRSLLSTPDGKERALLSHNRDVALMRNGELLTLGIGKTHKLWSIDRHTYELTGIDLTRDSTILLDAIAYYQVAYDMFNRGKLRPQLSANNVQNSGALSGAHSQ